MASGPRHPVPSLSFEAAPAPTVPQISTRRSILVKMTIQKASQPHWEISCFSTKTHLTKALSATNPLVCDGAQREIQRRAGKLRQRKRDSTD